MANLLTIQDKLVRLLNQEAAASQRLGTNSFLQHTHAESLNWTDARLTSFLENTVRTKFGVTVQKKNIKVTMNGSSATIGDLVIAIFLAMERQHKKGTMTIGHQSPMSV